MICKTEKVEDTDWHCWLVAPQMMNQLRIYCVVAALSDLFECMNVKSAGAGSFQPCSWYHHLILWIFWSTVKLKSEDKRRSFNSQSVDGSHCESFHVLALTHCCVNVTVYSSWLTSWKNKFKVSSVHWKRDSWKKSACFWLFHYSQYSWRLPPAWYCHKHAQHWAWFYISDELVVVPRGLCSVLKGNYWMKQEKKG